MDGEEMDDKQINHISNWASDCISTDQYRTTWNKITNSPNFPKHWTPLFHRKVSGVQTCIGSICFPVPSIVVSAPLYSVTISQDFSQSRYKASVQSPSWGIIHSWIISKISCVTFSPPYTVLNPLEKYAEKDDSHILLLNLTLWCMTCEDLDMSPCYIPPFKYIGLQYRYPYHSDQQVNINRFYIGIFYPLPEKY